MYQQCNDINLCMLANWFAELVYTSQNTHDANNHGIRFFMLPHCNLVVHTKYTSNMAACFIIMLSSTVSQSAKPVSDTGQWENGTVP